MSLSGLFDGCFCLCLALPCFMFYVSRANKERSERDILSRKSIRTKKMVKVGTGNMKPDDFSVTGTHNGRREPTPES